MTHEDVEVAVLGPVSVSGLPLAFRRAAARELVVYLGFHREGVGRPPCPRSRGGR